MNAPEGFNLEFHDLHPTMTDSRAELAEGLGAQRKHVNPKFFYDERGSELFEEITRLPEYYPTRAEQRILSERAEEIAEEVGYGTVLIEPGAGSCEKVRLLLNALRPRAFVPLDISADFLRGCAESLARDFPWLAVHAVCADFNAPEGLASLIPEGPRLVFYPGSTIGNLEPHAAREFLLRVHDWMRADGGALIGVDLHKDSAVLERAYNDSAGVTAAFNLNVLRRANALLDADFDLAAFRHHAFYDRARRRIEMHLVSEYAQSVRVGESRVDFDAGETIHTECSYKYTVDSFEALANTAGLHIRHSWLDPDRLFSVHYLVHA